MLSWFGFFCGSRARLGGVPGYVPASAVERLVSHPYVCNQTILEIPLGNGAKIGGSVKPPGGTRPYSILVVEDNESDVFLLEKALEGQDLDFQLTHLRNGSAALAFIRREGPYANMPRPDLILVNMNLPDVDGEEIFHQIRDARHLNGVPVCVWSSSEFDGQSASRLGADEFILKRSGLEQFMQIGKTVKDLLSRFVS